MLDYEKPRWWLKSIHLLKKVAWISADYFDIEMFYRVKEAQDKNFWISFEISLERLDQPDLWLGSSKLKADWTEFIIP